MSLPPKHLKIYLQICENLRGPKVYLQIFLLKNPPIQQEPQVLTHLMFGIKFALKEIRKISTFHRRLDVVESRIETLRIENSGLGTDAGHDRVLHVQRELDLHRTLRRHVPSNERTIVSKSRFDRITNKKT